MYCPLVGLVSTASDFGRWRYLKLTHACRAGALEFVGCTETFVATKQ